MTDPLLGASAHDDTSTLDVIHVLSIHWLYAALIVNCIVFSIMLLSVKEKKNPVPLQLSYLHHFGPSQ
jgi:hypothetical protein